MLDLCRCGVAWRPIRLPASVCPGVVLRTRPVDPSSGVAPSCVLMRALVQSLGTQGLHGYGPVSLHITIDQRLSGRYPTPPPDEIPYIMVSGTRRPRSTRIMSRLRAT